LFQSGFCDLRQKRFAELVKVNLDGVARRSLVPPMGMPDFPFDACAKIGRARQPPRDLKGRNTRLVIGEIPDAAERLK
jgi:hypothetical protein